MASATPSGGWLRLTTRALVAAFDASRRCTSPTAIIAPPARRASRQQLRGDRRYANGEWDTFLAVAFPDDQMQVLPYNRVVKDLGTHTPESFLDRDRCSDSPCVDGPRRSGAAAARCRCSSAAWYTHRPRRDAAGTAAAGRAARRQPAAGRQSWRRCSASAIRAPTSASTSSAAPAAPRSWSGSSTAGRRPSPSRCIPVSVDDLMAISDAGGIMPPKSTWFEPKLRDGLLSHVI